MTPTATLPERAKIIEAALRSGDPKSFLTGLQSAFVLFGRIEDFVTVAELSDLFEKGEIEHLQYRKSQWRQNLA